jgi:histidinol phosphatase-like PHP family hydrolase
MKNRILGNLNQSHNNYILPFLWVHGEEEPVLRNMMKTIQESGIEAVCIESRPHPDFVGPQWWHDMDIILNEARKREMKVWILDDSHFPTGYAAGRIKSDYPELKKWYLDKKDN